MWTVNWRRAIAAVLLGLAACWAWGQEPERNDLRFDRVSLYDLVRVIYGDVLHRAFVIDPSLFATDAVTSIDLRSGSNEQVEAVVLAALDASGYRVRLEKGLSIIEKKPDQRVGQRVFSYRPRFRTVAYLQNATRSFVFRGRFAGITSVGGAALPPPTGPAGGMSVPSALGGAAGPASTTQITPGGGVTAGSSDVLLFQGPEDEVALLTELVERLDVPVADVIIRASVWEVQTTKNDSSAVSLAVGLLGGRLSGNVGTAAAVPTVSLRAGSFDAAVAFLAQDSRFKLVSTPSLRVSSGESARVSVGADVPVLGALTVPTNGAPVQSVNYQASGIMLDIRPVALKGTVEVGLTQQISNFAKTETGVNGSPTLLKREIASKVSLAPGEVVFLGGLEDSNQNEARSGLPFLPNWAWSRSSDETRTDLVVMLQVDVVPESKDRHGTSGQTDSEGL